MSTLKQRLHRKNASGTYDTIHLETSADCITGTLGIANGGTGLTVSPSLLVDLASDQTANVLQTSPRPGCGGILPIARGGTGATTAANARSTLGITPANIGAAASSHNHSASNITSGTLSVARGGTGVTSLDTLKSILGIGNLSSLNLIIYSYRGNGRGGRSHPCTITMQVPIKLAFMLGEFGEAISGYPSAYISCMIPDELSTSYKSERGFVKDSSIGASYGAVSSDKKTIKWYYDDGNNSNYDHIYQYNESGKKYYVALFV